MFDQKNRKIIIRAGLTLIALTFSFNFVIPSINLNKFYFGHIITLLNVSFFYAIIPIILFWFVGYIFKEKLKDIHFRSIYIAFYSLLPIGTLIFKFFSELNNIENNYYVLMLYTLIIDLIILYLIGIIVILQSLSIKI